MADRSLERAPLRVAIVRIIAVLVLGATTVVTLGSLIAVSSTLNRQLDESIVLALNTSLDSIHSQVDDPEALPMYRYDDSFPITSGSFRAILVDDVVTTSNIFTGKYVLRTLNARENRTLAASTEPDGGLFTISIDGNQYRSLATYYDYDSNGRGAGGVVVVGVEETPIVSTLITLLVTTCVMSLVAATVAAVLGYRSVRRAMVPLEQIVEISDEVATMPLSSGAIIIGRRLNPVELGERTEAGMVGLALNRLLDNVEMSLDARFQTEEAMRRFVAEASHELRNPLASIRGYAEHNARASDVPDEVRRGLSRITSESIRLSSLVADLLTLAKLDAGRDLARSPTDLSLLLVETVEDARIASPERVWTFKLPPTPVIVESDEAAIRQVLINLCANAREHTPAKTAVTVSLIPGTEFVAIEVADQGPGIAPEIVPRIFDRFSQGRVDSSRRTGSVGLGLAIVDATVQALGGTVSVLSSVDGTTFRVQIPRQRA
ncbi:hypothetical protein PlfCFBP13513_15070 [Plantibacter flavus]|uniref:sensor histidine kinase n=1 Tax=Plantibacter TaxID=190323 RepID=UPI0010C174D3|nr:MULTISPECIES: HAMP domain-containing sensor histidine kinase [Plantibacter]MBD8103818.1 HAMP domain-containing histidine kinase [Plantibacter sp. CFBP 8775]MBD8467266.1 HAMP domain-containing histidine kinase [Plantibacter sp. CFBP 8798]TKJ96742.1 hypothetical protein PlfCFBP13513_15070 [Plantibacter flavus]